MQEAHNSYEKDEQQERGNYDSAIYMGVCRNQVAETDLKSVASNGVWVQIPLPLPHLSYIISCMENG